MVYCISRAAKWALRPLALISTWFSGLSHTLPLATPNTNGTRPDCSFATNILAQVASNPGRIHWEAAKHVVQYLKGTKERRLTYGAGPAGLYGYSDASF